MNDILQPCLVRELGDSLLWCYRDHYNVSLFYWDDGKKPDPYNEDDVASLCNREWETATGLRLQLGDIIPICVTAIDMGTVLSPHSQIYKKDGYAVVEVTRNCDEVRVRGSWIDYDKWLRVTGIDVDEQHFTSRDVKHEVAFIVTRLDDPLLEDEEDEHEDVAQCTTISHNDGVG